MSKETKGKILIVLGILIALFGVFLLNSRENKKEELLPTNITNITNRQDLLNKQVLPVENKAILEINGIKYESEIADQMSVYDFMTQLQNEGKITFKEKNYPGMGKFIEEINGVKGSGEKYWIYYINNKKAEVGVSNYKLNPGDVVSWKYESSY